MDKLPERVAAQQKIREVTPKKMDLVREFGEENLRESTRGWRYDFKKKDGSVDMKKFRAFKEMMRPANRLETRLAMETAPPEVKPEKKRGPTFTVPALPWHTERKLNLAGEHE